MKAFYSTVLLLFISFSFAQSKETITIQWSDKSSYVIGDTSYSVPQFQMENFLYDSSEKTLSFAKPIKTNLFIDPKSIQISNLQLETISEKSISDLDLNKIPNEINLTVSNNYGRNDKYSTVLFSPIIKTASGYQKVISFSYTYIYTNESENRNANTTLISNSVLASGDFYRFYIQKSGVYIITKDFMRQLGINVDNINLQNLKIYGNGGAMLPLKNNIYYPDDLTENAIEPYGLSDNSFDEGDGFIFYGEGLDNWNTESLTNLNLYTNKSYYYISASGGNGKRITENPQITSTPTVVYTDFDDTQFHEVDAVNIVKLGRTWYGEQFNVNNIQEFSFSIPNIVPNSIINFSTSCAGVSLSASNFNIEANNQQIGTISLSQGDGKLPSVFGLFANVPATESLNIKYTYNNNGVPTANGYLNYINLSFQRLLKGYGKQFRFQKNTSNNNQIKQYSFTNASNIKAVWDITDKYDATKYSNANQSDFSFVSDAITLRKYIAVDYSDLYSPSKDSQSRIANQDLKGTIFNNQQGQFQDVDYLIITPGQFYNQAERLAVFHRNYSLLNVKVVTLESIYPEFSSGQQDLAAIRNFIKYVYFNASSPDKKVKYVNLFGDASFDFKSTSSINTNFVPIYQSLNSNTINESSFASDDFFAYMDLNEGYTDFPVGELDIAVGRMIANSTQQADDLVTKVIDYHDIKAYGNWRNDFTMIADDSDAASDATLQTRINSVSDMITSQKPFMNVKKVLLDSYVQETSAGGKRYPQARKDIFNAFEKGSLVFNYLGHGGEDGLSQERIWEKADGINLNNRYKYPLFITITCDFSRFDNPYRPTAGEYVYWNPKGGAISMITTVREIGQGTGESFNDTLAKYIFAYNTNDYTSLAESLRLSKNEFGGYTRIVAYLGDPALVLAMAKPKVRLTKVNDVPITQPIDDFKALSLMKIEGEITDENDNFLSTYNGDVAVQIFDKDIVRTTLNNDNNSPPINFNVLGETIFRGNASVANGKFEFSFVVPRDISIAVGNGKMSFYAKRNNILLDKTGYDTTIKIGGVNLNAAVDDIPPTVRLYMNDESFVSGGNTNESPIFLAFLEDENGINTASGIGHDIVAILDGDETNPYKLNDYYETELDNYKKGKLKFPFRNLALGLHTLTFKAWDVYNNPIIAEIQFVVVGNDTLTLSNVLNYPNPFVNYTQFWFTHNKPFEALDVQVQIMTITGKVIWTKNQVISTEGFLSKEISWDGRDDFGDKIGKGVYVYKLTVKSNISNTKTEKYEKLVIL